MRLPFDYMAFSAISPSVINKEKRHNLVYIEIAEPPNQSGIDRAIVLTGNRVYRYPPPTFWPCTPCKLKGFVGLVIGRIRTPWSLTHAAPPKSRAVNCLKLNTSDSILFIESVAQRGHFLRC